MEQGSFYNSINFDLTYSDPTNTTVSILPLPFLYCPSDPGSHIDDGTLGGTGYATTSYGTVTATGTSGRSTGEPRTRSVR